MGSGGLSKTLLSIGGIALAVAVFTGIGIAVVLSIIPSYLSTRDVTPSGEKYCVNSLQLSLLFNATSPFIGFNYTAANASYPLSQACYRILQNYKYDRLLYTCLLSNCTLISNVDTITNTIITTNLSCLAEVYYKTRCTDQPPLSGLFYYFNTSTSSACRTQRLENINGALGSSSIYQFTNVIGLFLSGIVVPVYAIFTIPFSYYSQPGAFYCGVASQSSITSAVYTQETG